MLAIISKYCVEKTQIGGRELGGVERVGPTNPMSVPVSIRSALVGFVGVATLKCSFSGL